MTIFTFNDSGEVDLSPAQVQQIAESYSWPYEWEVASELKAQRDAYKAQLDQAVEALEIVLPHADHLAECCFYDGQDLCDCAVSSARNKARAATAATEDE